jgi:hypothetical protein
MPTGSYDRIKSKPRKTKMFCKNGHNTSICGRNKNHSCRECIRERDRANYIPHPLPKTMICINGHDKNIVGTYGKGACKACVKLNNTRESKLKYRFGITVEQYDEMFNEQKGRCAGCNKHQSELIKRLYVDHNHQTGNIRGLLCGNCNLALGNAKDDVIILTKLIEYLKKN